MPIPLYDRQDGTPRAFMSRAADGSDFSGTPEINISNDCPQQVRDIIEHHLPVWLDLFQMKSREYGDAAFDLGARAQFVDMNRKFVKLRQGIWDGREDLLTTEGIDEILLDLIGHAFLTLEMRRRERTVTFD